MKRNFKGFEAWVLTTNSDNVKNIGLKPSVKFELNNGPLQCKFEKFEIFDGTYKDMKIKGFEEAISHRYVDEGDDDLHPYPIEDLDCEA